MPVQVFDLSPTESNASLIGKSIGQGIGGHFQKQQMQQQQGQLAQALFGQEANQFAQLPMQEQLKVAEMRQNQQQKSDEFKINKEKLSALEKERGLEEGALAPFINDVSLAERVSRPQKKTQAAQPIDPEQLNIINKLRREPDWNDLDELEKYQRMTGEGVSKENAEAEAKLTGQKREREQKGFDNAYSAQLPFINETTDKYKAFETDMKPRLMQMQSIPDENIIGPTAAAFLDTMGIPLGALEDPSSELYQKLSFDLLKGLPETFGSRILKVEVDNFLKTIPSLLNSPEGRRMIASNMLKLGEMKEVYYNEMRKQQKEALDNEKIPKDFQQRVFDQVKPQIDRINDEFVKMAEVKSVPQNTIPFFDPNGNIVFIPNQSAQEAINRGGRRIW